MKPATSLHCGSSVNDPELNDVTPFFSNSSWLEDLVPRSQSSETSEASRALLLNSYARSHIFWHISLLSVTPTKIGVGRMVRRNGLIDRGYASRPGRSRER